VYCVIISIRYDVSWFTVVGEGGGKVSDFLLDDGR